MTDVLILKRIAGYKPGEVVPITRVLAKHVKAGNAKVLPNEHPETPTREGSYAPRPVLQVVAEPTIEEQIVAELEAATAPDDLETDGAPETIPWWSSAEDAVEDSDDDTASDEDSSEDD